MISTLPQRPQDTAYAGVLVGIADTDDMMRVSGNPQDWIAIGSTTFRKIRPEATTSS
jgi:hypothetical protein